MREREGDERERERERERESGIKISNKYQEKWLRMWWWKTVQVKGIIRKQRNVSAERNEKRTKKYTKKKNV